MICLTCGVAVAASRGGRWLHTDDVPKSFEPHDAVPVLPSAREATQSDFVSLAQAARDMLTHHATLHPESDCAWTRNLREALDRS